MAATGLRLRPISLRPSAAALDPALAVAGAATLLGFALRAAAMTGDPGLDEIWSLQLVGRVHALGQVFWGISHDNNHLLNSAWLYLIDQDAPLWVERLPALLLGTLTVPALARLCWRRSAAAGALAALLGAVAFPLVDFGSEARGYAGLALATVLACDAAGRAVDAALADDRSGRQREAWRLGLAVGFGILCHLTMAYAVAVMGLATLIRAEVHRHPRMALALASRVFAPSAVLALPAIAALLVGIAVRGTFTIGDIDPFSLDKLVQGFGGMILFTAGLPDTAPPIIGVVGAVGLLAAATRLRLASPWMIALGVAALVAFPLAVAAARLPNVIYTRYFAVSGIVMMGVLAEVLGTLWRRDAEARRQALMAALAMAAGGLILDGLAIRDGRGGFAETLAIMRAEGAPTYVADRVFMAAMLLDDAARRSGRPAPRAVAEVDLCRTPPDWSIAVGVLDSRPDGAAIIGPPSCRTRYGLRRAFPASPSSGTQWTLYRRD